MLQRLAIINANVADCSHSLDADQDCNYWTIRKKKKKKKEAATGFRPESRQEEMSSVGELLSMEAAALSVEGC